MWHLAQGESGCGIQEENRNETTQILCKNILYMDINQVYSVWKIALKVVKYFSCVIKSRYKMLSAVCLQKNKLKVVWNE